MLNVLERLPQTFYYLDTWRGNLFAIPQADGDQQLVAIGRAYPGLGTIATDFGDLRASSFSLLRVEPCEPRTSDTVILRVALPPGGKGRALCLYTFDGSQGWLSPLLAPPAHR